MKVLLIIIAYLVIGRLWHWIHYELIQDADDGLLLAGGLLWPMSIAIEIFMCVICLIFSVIAWDWGWIGTIKTRIEEKWGSKNGG